LFKIPRNESLAVKDLGVGGNSDVVPMEAFHDGGVVLRYVSK